LAAYSETALSLLDPHSGARGFPMFPMGYIAVLPLLAFGMIFFHPYIFAALVILPIFGVLVFASFLDLIFSFFDKFREKPEKGHSGKR
jgi:hypothetical protein